MTRLIVYVTVFVCVCVCACVCVRVCSTYASRVADLADATTSQVVTDHCTRLSLYSMYTSYIYAYIYIACMHIYSIYTMCSIRYCSL